MQNQDSKHAAERRRSVSELLRRFFSELTTQLSTSTAEFWSRVEQRTVERRAPETPDTPPHKDTQPTQRPPTQQSKNEPEEKK